MSTGAVIEFINRSDADPALQAELQETHGVEAVISLASARGYDFDAPELGRITSLLTFLRDLMTTDDLRAAVWGATSDEAIARLAAEHGYTFEAEDLAVVSIVEADELGDEELDAVSGGAGQVTQSGLRVQIGEPVRRQTTKNDFSSVLGKGTSKTGDASASIAAPFIPGGSVLSAAISG